MNLVYDDICEIKDRLEVPLMRNGLDKRPGSRASYETMFHRLSRGFCGGGKGVGEAS